MKNGIRLLIVLACCLAAAAQTAQKKVPTPKRAPAPPQSQPLMNSGNDEQDLVDLERHILDFIRAKNSKDLEPWVAEDFQYSDVAGKTLDREKFLSVVKSVKGEIEWLSADDVHVRVLGPVAVLTGVQQSRISSAPADVIPGPDTPPAVATKSAFTDIFRRRGSSWELVMVYAAELGQPEAPAAVQPQPAAPKADEKPAAKQPRGEDDPPVIRKPPGAL